jgi:hypothetical protein
MTREVPARQYRYGDEVRLGVGTDFLHLLSGMAAGVVYYDPGIKMEVIGGRVTTKRRSQWRVKAKDLPTLYEHWEIVSL